MARRVTVFEERFLLHRPFTISRLKPRYEAIVVTVEIEEGGVVGRGECQALHHTAPLSSSPLDEISRLKPLIEKGISRVDLQKIAPATFGRNALDCALWAIESYQKNTPIHQLIGLGALKSVETLYTLSLSRRDEMVRDAVENQDKPFLKIKLGASDGDMERLSAIRKAVPSAKMMVDANTSWTRQQLIDYMPRLKALDITMIEQPFPPGKEEWLKNIPRLIPIIADEACQTSACLKRIKGFYDVINIKLDKAGGLTEALKLLSHARKHGFGVMVGCNLASSLSIAPAFLLAQKADFIDLDVPLLLKTDREHAITNTGHILHKPHPLLWPA